VLQQWNVLENFANFLWSLDKNKTKHFLNIAYFFTGFKRKTCCQVYWNANGLSHLMLRLQSLKDKYLIKWAKDGSLYMHEQL
jgi:hypothetical protein